MIMVRSNITRTWTWVDLPQQLTIIALSCMLHKCVCLLLHFVLLEHCSIPKLSKSIGAFIYFQTALLPLIVYAICLSVAVGLLILMMYLMLMLFAMVVIRYFMLMLMLMLFAMVVAMIYLFLFLQQRPETRPTHDTPASHLSLSTLMILMIKMRII